MPFWPLSDESEAILSKMFRPGHRAGVFIWENFHPGYRDLGNRASPASHINTSMFLQRKEWRGEISETEPALPVDRAHMQKPLKWLYDTEKFPALSRNGPQARASTNGVFS